MDGQGLLVGRRSRSWRRPLPVSPNDDLERWAAEHFRASIATIGVNAYHQGAWSGNFGWAGQGRIPDQWLRSPSCHPIEEGRFDAFFEPLLERCAELLEMRAAPPITFVDDGVDRWRNIGDRSGWPVRVGGRSRPDGYKFYPYSLAAALLVSGRDDGGWYLVENAAPDPGRIVCFAVYADRIERRPLAVAMPVDYPR